MIKISRKILEEMLYFAQINHPNEIILLLRGTITRKQLEITEHLIPPLSIGGRGFAEFRPHMLPMDFTIMGTAHSHPTGSHRPSPTDLNSHRPSPTDLNNFYSKVMLIIAAPYTTESVGLYNAHGEQLEFILE